MRSVIILYLLLCHTANILVSSGEERYEFTCLPNGLTACQRICSMLLKPIYSYLSKKGLVISPYIDDSFVIADSVTKCQNVLNELCITLTSSGFCVHQHKSVCVSERETNIQKDIER
jgi:hypothetical protein